jgi:hypothetical protein
MIIKQNFSPMHTVGSRVTESKNQSNQVKSYTVPAQHYFMVDTQKISLSPGTSEKGRAFEITNQMTKPQNHRLTSIDSTKNPCS